MFGLADDIVEGYYSPIQIWDVDVIESLLLLSEPPSNILSLFNSLLSQLPRLVTSQRSINIILSLSVSRKDQSNAAQLLFFFHLTNMLLVTVILNIQSDDRSSRGH